jgi:hypothetical protein
MITGKEVYKKVDQPKKKETSLVGFSKTNVEAINLRPQCSEFLKKGEGVGGGQKPLIDDGSPMKKRPVTAVQR